MFEAHEYGRKLAKAEAKVKAMKSRRRLEKGFKMAENQLKARLDSLRRLSDEPAGPTAEEKLERARQAVADLQNQRDITHKNKASARGRGRSSISVEVSIVDSTKSGQRPEYLDSVDKHQLFVSRKRVKPRGKGMDEDSSKDAPMVSHRDMITPAPSRNSVDMMDPRTGTFIEARRKSILAKKAKALVSRQKRDSLEL